MKFLLMMVVLLPNGQMQTVELIDSYSTIDACIVTSNAYNAMTSNTYICVADKGE